MSVVPWNTLVMRQNWLETNEVRKFELGIYGKNRGLENEMCEKCGICNSETCTAA